MMSRKTVMFLLLIGVTFQASAGKWGVVSVTLFENTASRWPLELDTDGRAYYLTDGGNPNYAGWMSGWHRIIGVEQWEISDNNSYNEFHHTNQLEYDCYRAEITVSWQGLYFDSKSTRTDLKCFEEPPEHPTDPDQEPAEEPPPGGYSPVILDLLGDGIRTTDANSGVTFDINGDGVGETIGWTDPSSHDAFLWIDLDRNHQVTDGRELFGVGTVLPNGARAADGFEALTVYDSPSFGGNGDGRITKEDEIWEHFWLWDDANHDGISDPGEIAPILTFGVTELSLFYETNSTPDDHGNIHLYRGVYGKRTPARGGAQVQYLAMEDVFFVPVP